MASYSYTILQYRHDVWTGEALNLGVLMFCPSHSYLSLKVRTGRARLGRVYPDIDHGALRQTIKGLEKYFANRLEKNGFLPRPDSALDFGRSVLADDDSSLRWFSSGSGLALDPAAAHEAIFARMVTRYEQEEGRDAITDEMVFERVKDKLQRAELLHLMQPTTVTSEFAKISFAHTIQNGKLHCIQPVSFDSVDEEQMQLKGAKWAGNMQSLQYRVDLKPYFVTGKPTNPALLPKYAQMQKLLRVSPLNPVVVDADEVDVIVGQLASAVKSHTDEAKPAPLFGA
ncbi:DUF3037 domain-containing protein [Cypionkella sp.]|uniref:DUF3037 domain-containing protein n=1 Tax=Cypionkella sp. TaxID=2811411 RepID=UPI002605F710|nr:DUF3037 domain-containing protein [Cypionkella sp.]